MKNELNIIEIVVVQHISGLYLYNNKFVDSIPKGDKLDLNCIGQIRDIKYKGSCSDNIIDTDYFSPHDYDKEEWDDVDDITDDYSEVKIDLEISGVWVEYYNFKMDYNIPNHVGGYSILYKNFDSEIDAEEFLSQVREHSRGTIINLK